MIRDPQDVSPSVPVGHVSVCGNGECGRIDSKRPRLSVSLPITETYPGNSFFVKRDTDPSTSPRRC